jgi:hypothetical protein
VPREILVDWTTASGAGKVSVLWFGTSTAVASQRTALGTMLGSVDGGLDNGVSWSIRQSGREVDDATGGLTGVWSDAASHTGTGGVAGEPVPDAAMMLFRWHTDHIVNGRFLQGRTFIPGLSDGNMVDGNLSSAQVTNMASFGQTLIAAAVQVGVWHRPTSGSGGVFWAADTCTVWEELAVLRRRRG